MKKNIILLLIVALITTTVAGLPKTRARATELQAEVVAAQKTVTVKASEEIQVAPDVAYVNLSITTKNSSVREAQRLNTEISNKTIEKIGALGIDKQDITTSNYCVYPDYEYAAGANKQTGYVATNSLRVKVKDFALMGKVVDVAGAAGANGVSGVEFAVLDSTDAYNTALIKAIECAKSKALAIAAAYQLDLGAPLTIKETEQFDNRIGLFAARAFAEDSTSISPDKLTVKAGVEVTYVLEQPY